MTRQKSMRPAPPGFYQNSGQAAGNASEDEARGLEKRIRERKGNLQKYEQQVNVIDAIAAAWEYGSTGTTGYHERKLAEEKENNQDWAAAQEERRKAALESEIGLREMHNKQHEAFNATYFEMMGDNPDRYRKELASRQAFERQRAEDENKLHPGSIDMQELSDTQENQRTLLDRKLGLQRLAEIAKTAQAVIRARESGGQMEAGPSCVTTGCRTGANPGAWRKRP